MVKVKRLKIQSFRGIGDLTLEFDVSEPKELQHLIGRPDQLTYECYRTQTPGMLLALQQILLS